MIKIIRKIFSGNLLVDYKIIIDDIEYGIVKGGRTKLLDIGLGKHTIYVKINDVAISNTINFNIIDNKMITFECGNNMLKKEFQYNWASRAFMLSPNNGFEYLWIKMKLN